MTNDDTRTILENATTVAVVGASNDESKPAGSIPRGLIERGFDIWPVNPNDDTVLGRQAYASLEDLPGAPDVVDVFRPAKEAPGIAHDAAAAGAKVLWLQKGVISEEARRIAEEAGLVYVEDRCMGAESDRHDIRKAGGGT